MKRKPTIFLYIFVFLFVLSFFKPTHYNYDNFINRTSIESTSNINSIPIANNENELFSIIGNEISSLKSSLTVKTTFEIKSYDITFPDIYRCSRKIDQFSGSLLKSMNYSISPCEKGCEINFKFYYYIDESDFNKLCLFAEEFSENITHLSDYEKIKYTHDYLIENCTYIKDLDGPYNCIFQNKSNCNGYALSFCLIMQKCNIECKYVTGLNHAWNAVKLNGLWYNIDVTWDDTDVENNISYDYFLKGRSDWKKHDSTEATAGYTYNPNNDCINWVKTIFYYIRIPSIIFICILAIIIFKKIRKGK